MKSFPLLFLLIILCSIQSFGQTKTAATGNWDDPNTWSPTGVPGDNDIILIPVGVTVTVLGTDHTLANAVLVIRGTLSMESTCNFCTDYASLTFTGSGSGVIIEDGGQVNDDTLFGGDTHFISVDGTTFWSGDNCAANCGSTIEDFTSTGETGWPASMTNPLPVEFLFFSATVESRSILLNWATASEETNSHFEVERSIDGENFTQIGEVTGSGDSKERIDYDYFDYEVPQGIATFYYRLKQVDYDGKYEYSKTVAALGSSLEPLEIIVRGNPFREEMTVTLSSTNDESMQIRILDLQGRELYASSHQVYQGMNDLDVTNLGHLMAGTYLLNLSSPTMNQTRRVIKSQ